MEAAATYLEEQGPHIWWTVRIRLTQPSCSWNWGWAWQHCHLTLTSTQHQQYIVTFLQRYTTTTQRYASKRRYCWPINIWQYILSRSGCGWVGDCFKLISVVNFEHYRAFVLRKNDKGKHYSMQVEGWNKCLLHMICDIPAAARFLCLSLDGQNCLGIDDVMRSRLQSLLAGLES